MWRWRGSYDTHHSLTSVRTFPVGRTPHSAECTFINASLTRWCGLRDRISFLVTPASSLTASPWARSSSSTACYPSITSSTTTSCWTRWSRPAAGSTRRPLTTASRPTTPRQAAPAARPRPRRRSCLRPPAACTRRTPCTITSNSSAPAPVPWRFLRPVPPRWPPQSKTPRTRTRRPVGTAASGAAWASAAFPRPTPWSTATRPCTTITTRTAGPAPAPCLPWPRPPSSITRRPPRPPWPRTRSTPRAQDNPVLPEDRSPCPTYPGTRGCLSQVSDKPNFLVFKL